MNTGLIRHPNYHSKTTGAEYISTVHPQTNGMTEKFKNKTAEVLEEFRNS